MMYNSGGPGRAGGSARLQKTTAAGRPEVKRGFAFLRHDVRGHAIKRKGIAAISRNPRVLKRIEYIRANFPRILEASKMEPWTQD